MNDSEFDQWIRNSTAEVAQPAGFQRGVWLRIEAAEANAWKPRMGRMLDRFFEWMALPPVATAACMAMVLAGAWFGFAPARSPQSVELVYARSISPFAQTHH